MQFGDFFTTKFWTKDLFSGGFWSADYESSVLKPVFHEANNVRKLSATEHFTESVVKGWGKTGSSLLEGGKSFFKGIFAVVAVPLKAGLHVFSSTIGAARGLAERRPAVAFFLMVTAAAATIATAATAWLGFKAAKKTAHVVSGGMDSLRERAASRALASQQAASFADPSLYARQGDLANGVLAARGQQPQGVSQSV